MGVISVAIADDNERMVEILDSIVKKDESLHIVGKANNGEDVYIFVKCRDTETLFGKCAVMFKINGQSTDDTITKK